MKTGITGYALAVSILVMSSVSICVGAELESKPVENPRFTHEADLYKRYCSACHGVDGRGDGIVAPFMDPSPIDLTAIKVNFDGVFPKYLVTMTVDGRDTIRAHGDSDMPVWGEVFAEEFLPDPSARAKARGKVMKIVDYVESIQR